MPWAGHFLVAALNIRAGEILGIAECAVKLLDMSTVSSSEEWDMEYR